MRRALIHSAVAMVALAGAGCATPLHDANDRAMRRAVRQSAEREIAEARASPEPITLGRENRVNELRIDPAVMDRLSAMAGPESYKGFAAPLGRPLLGSEQATAPLTLRRAVLAAVKHNLNVEFARIGPAIGQAQVAAAEAAFDWVFFGSTQWSRTHEPRTSQNFSSVVEDNRDVADFVVGVRKPLIAGGTLTLQHEFTRTDTNTANLTVRPNPTSENNLVIQLDQPLLRNFGSDVAQAQVRVARNTELDSIQQLKGTLLQFATNAETAYWNLVRAQANLRIVQRLQERGEETLGVLRGRRLFDAKPAAISNAAAAVEARRGDVLRAQRTLREASDQLKVLMNDPVYPIGGEPLLVAADEAVDQPIRFSLVDAINSGLANRPEIQRAVIAMDSASIREGVADNGRLPLLNLRALTRFSGLGGSTGTAYDALGEANFVDYQISLNLEQPIGNRGPEAAYRQRRLERMQTAVVYRAQVQTVVQDIKSALRDIQTNYELIGQTVAARVAAAEDLRTLLVEEETIGALTPEFLNLKLQRQQAIAVAEQQEVQALTDYNTAIARYYSATGTALERNRISFDVPDNRPEAKTSDLFPDWPAEPAPQKAGPGERTAGP